MMLNIVGVNKKMVISPFPYPYKFHNFFVFCKARPSWFLRTNTLALICTHFPGHILFTSLNTWMLPCILQGASILLYIENPRIVRGFSKSFSVASSKSYSFRVRLDCGPSTAIKTLKEAI